ncbi:MAG: tetratricopeptide repeat protein, partial [Anaerolineales bacterium]|nr:tetratricopeptide repeat protein [Anaerolineales bacterium]
LYIPPLWWFIIQPLRLQRIRRQGNALPYLVAFGGIGLAVLLLLTGFNVPLTVPDIYPLLTAIILSSLGAYTLWRFRLAHNLGRLGQLLGLRPVRALVGAAAVTAALLMLAFLVRELGVYHLRIQADAARDEAVRLGQAAEVEPETMLNSEQRTELEQAVLQYSQAISWSTAPLPYLNSPQLVADLYVNRAIARMSIGTELEPDHSYLTPTLELDLGQYEAAFADFQRAIDLEPARAEFYLWRGFAQHSLGANSYLAALTDYEAAIKLDSLTTEQTVKAYTGIGWIYYSSEEPEAARDAFLAAVSSAAEDGVSPESRSDALLGLGYSYYALGEYDKAREAWESAQVPEATDPMIYVSLGTLHWRLGTLDPNGVGRDLCRTQNIPEAWQRAAALELWQAIDYLNRAVAIPGQDPASLAFTYRTRAQVEYLLSPCPGEDELDLIEASIASYGAALEFDPENATYWQMRGRIRYAAWSASPAGTGASARVFLFDGIEDLVRAIAIRPDDANGYQPNRWLTILSAEAIDGSIRQGEARLRDAAYAEALAYFELVAGRAPDNSQAAFLAGLTSLYLEEETAARDWYAVGLERASAAPDGRTQIEIALKQLSGAQLPVAMRPVQIEVVTQLREALSQLPTD